MQNPPFFDVFSAQLRQNSLKIPIAAVHLPHCRCSPSPLQVFAFNRAGALRKSPLLVFAFPIAGVRLPCYWCSPRKVQLHFPTSLVKRFPESVFRLHLFGTSKRLFFPKMLTSFTSLQRTLKNGCFSGSTPDLNSAHPCPVCCRFVIFCTCRCTTASLVFAEAVLSLCSGTYCLPCLR